MEREGETHRAVPSTQYSVPRPSQPKEQVHARGKNGVSLLVRFVWRGDRYSHVISLFSATGEDTPILESIEGTADQDWPDSPPLQSLHIEERAGGTKVALLVGMAGRSHWSASIEAAPGEAKLIFDFACRHPTDVAWIGNRYRALAGATERIAIEPIAARVQIGAGSIHIEPESQPTQAATTRWQFAIALRP